MNGTEDPDAEVIHGNVVRWHVDARTHAGDQAAVIGVSTVIDTITDRELATISVYVSLIDGAIVIEVDTSRQRAIPLRLNVNNDTELDTTCLANPVTPPDALRPQIA